MAQPFFTTCHGVLYADDCVKILGRMKHGAIDTIFADPPFNIGKVLISPIFWEDTSPNRHKKFKVRPGVNELKLVIPERAILISTNPGDIILDPFGGGGSTYQVAEIHHRNWVGIELYDSEHIRKRLEEGYMFSANQEPDFDVGALFTHENKQDSVLRRGEREGLPARVGTHIP